MTANHADFTRTAAAMVARNDRPRTLRAFMLRAARRVAVAWSSLALAAVALSMLPMNVRGA